MAEVTTAVDTCLICKHALITRLNIFRTRTNFSKTLISSKLSKLVQMPFKQDCMEDSSDICSNCSALINQVDECEIKLMALENEVKLKFKMPFPIEVHSRRTEGQQEMKPPSPRGDDGGGGAAGQTQEFSFISIDGEALDSNPTIVLQTDRVDVDGGSVVVYREPNYSEPPQQQQEVQYSQSMPYLSDLTSPDGHHDYAAADDDDDDDDDDRSEERVYQKRPKPQKKAKREADGGGGPCELCDQVFYSDIKLRMHRASHASERSYACRFCARVFTTNMALHFHMNEEHPMKLQPCPYCEKRFLNRSNLNQHINTHKDPRFSCDQCTRQFHTKADLRKHTVFKHSEAKNFPCPDCTMSFKVNWLLTRHRVRVHHHTS